MLAVCALMLLVSNAFKTPPDILRWPPSILPRDFTMENIAAVLETTPLLRGPLGALGVLAFFNAWTAFAWPMIVATTKEAYTIEVGLALFQTGFAVDLGRMSAAATVLLVPSVLVFSLLRRNFVQGMATSGLKD